MASNSPPISVTAALLFAVLFLSSADSVGAIHAREFDSMLDALRVHGYHLFCNAIVTSDLQFDVIHYENEAHSTNNTSFTLFAPTDSSLFALDMTQSASFYTDTLRYHVVPHRLSITELQLLSTGSSVPTLLPGRYLNITRVLGSDVIAVGGVDIAFPGLFYGRDVVVHGLAGILTLRSNTAPAPAADPVRSSGQHSSPPRIDTISFETPPVASPPVNGTILVPAPAPSAINSHSSAVSGDSLATSTEPPVHSHISTPAAPAALTPTPLSPEYGHSAVYLPPTEPLVHSHISTPMSPTGLTPTSESPEYYSALHLPWTEPPVHGYISAPATPTSITLTPASPEYRYSAVSLPSMGFSDRAPSPLGPDVGQLKKGRVSLMETFVGGSEVEIRTVRFADEVPETPPPLAEKEEITEESEPFEGIVGCATSDVVVGFAGSTSGDHF